MAFKFKHVALGGTFDLLHKGHMALLTKAFSISKHVTIGITTDKYIDDTAKTPHQNQITRKKNLVKFLKDHKYLKETKIILLKDLYGPTLKDKTIEGLVVSPETIKGADLINKERIKSRLKSLKIIKVNWIKDSKGKVISSTRIRAGEIDCEGRLYKALLLKIAGKHLDQKTRQNLKKPFGRILKSINKSQINPEMKNIITVGDITTSNFLKAGIEPKLSIIDFIVERKPMFSNLKQLGFHTLNPDITVKNEPGQISKSLILTIEKSINNNSSQIILVDGEEDLAVIPAILLSPLGATIFYGQPHKGAVMVNVDIETKNKLCQLLKIL